MKNVQGSFLSGSKLGFPRNWWAKQLHSELGPVPSATLLIFLWAAANGVGIPRRKINIVYGENENYGALW